MVDRRIKEAVRYLGYGKTTIDEKILIMIQESFVELEKISELKSNYRIFELTENDDEFIQYCDVIINSNIKEVLDLCIEDNLKQSIDILSAKAKE